MRRSYRWQFRQVNKGWMEVFAHHKGLHPVLARILAARAHLLASPDFETFLSPRLQSLHDPFLLRDIEKAAERIRVALDRKEPILIFGDYDTDGTTATALLMRTLRFLGAEPAFCIPRRLEDGYGLKKKQVRCFAQNGGRLLITVDNGIGAIEQVALANKLGVDVIITDHHQASPQLPDALAIVNPNQPDCHYPNKFLAGVGVAFKLAHALLKVSRVPAPKAQPFLRSLLDLVAIGTVADVVPLVGENRILVHHGLEQIMRNPAVGIAQLRAKISADGQRLSAQDVGFRIAPRLNAAGRVADARMCVELLITTDSMRARVIAEELEQCNHQRRKLEQDIFNQCDRRILTDGGVDSRFTIVVDGEGWHLGVLGIVASKLVERWNRPAIVIARNGTRSRGSARSIENFNLFRALQACEDHLAEYGGHPHAAGLELETPRIPMFREAINAFAQKELASQDLSPQLMIDCEIAPSELTVDLVGQLEKLEPFGPENPRPVLVIRGVRLMGNPSIVGNDHLRLQFASNGKRFRAIGFGMGSCAQELVARRIEPLDVAFYPTVNTFRGDGRVELELRDIHFAGENTQ